jgi:hypothetical protein
VILIGRSVGEMLPWSSLENIVGCLTACGASIAAAVAVAQQAATEAPTGFDTPTLVENPGLQNVSNGIAEPAGESFVRRCQPIHRAACRPHPAIASSRFTP